MVSPEPPHPGADGKPSAAPGAIETHNPMKHDDGQSLTIEGLAKPSVRQTSKPDLPSLQWIHVIYDHSGDETDREYDLEAALPHVRLASANNARAEE